LHPGGEPVDAYRLAEACHFHQPLAQVGQGGDEGPVGLAVPEGGQWTKQQVQAVADLGLGDPHHPAGPPVRQPVQHDRGDGVQTDLQGQRRVAASSGWAGWQQVGQATGAGSAYQTVAWWSPRRSATCKLSPIVAVGEAVKESRQADAEVLRVSPSSQLAAAPAGG
jgi:hypothetical protein